MSPNSSAHMNLVPVTAAPTLHNDGDIWIENISGAWALKVRLNGATKTVLLPVGAAAGAASSEPASTDLESLLVALWHRLSGGQLVAQ